MTTICYNLTYQCRVDENNRPLASRPQLAFSEETNWELHFFQGELGTNIPADLSSLISCRAAVDCDYSQGSAPMCRTSTAIDLSRSAAGIITVPLNANTETFRTAIGASKEREAIFELQGFDTAGTALIASFEITVRNVIDAQGGEAPSAPQNDLASKAWTLAQIARQLIFEYSADGTSWHTERAAQDRYQRIRHGSDGVPSAAMEMTAAAVSSVNGLTGAVTLNAGSVGALPISGGSLSGNLVVSGMTAASVPEVTLTGATLSPAVLGHYSYTAEQGAAIYMQEPESGKTIFDFDISVPAGTVSFSFAQYINWLDAVQFNPGTTAKCRFEFSGGTWQAGYKYPNLSQYLTNSGGNMLSNTWSLRVPNVYQCRMLDVSIVGSNAYRLTIGGTYGGNYNQQAYYTIITGWQSIALYSKNNNIQYNNHNQNTKGGFCISDATTGNITSPGDVIATVNGGTVSLSELAARLAALENQ